MPSHSGFYLVPLMEGGKGGSSNNQATIVGVLASEWVGYSQV